MVLRMWCLIWITCRPRVIQSSCPKVALYFGRKRTGWLSRPHKKAFFQTTILPEHSLKLKGKQVVGSSSASTPSSEENTGNKRDPKACSMTSFVSFEVFRQARPLLAWVSAHKTASELPPQWGQQLVTSGDDEQHHCVECSCSCRGGPQ